MQKQEMKIRANLAIHEKHMNEMIAQGIPKNEASQIVYDNLMNGLYSEEIIKEYEKIKKKLTKK